MSTTDRLKAMFAEAKAYSLAMRDAEAEAIYRAILEVIPNDPIPAYNLATTLLRQGKYEEGFQWYEARAYVGSLKLVKPVYRPRPLPLPEGVDAWGAQTIDIEAIRPFLGRLDEIHDHAAVAASA